MKKVLEPFDIEKAKAGAKVVTRDGKSVRIKCYDKQGDDLPIIALINNKGIEEIRCYDNNGEFFKHCEGSYDLMLEETKFENGDILAKSYGKDLSIIIFRGLNDPQCNQFSYYAKLYSDGSVDLNWRCSGDDYKLATEEEKRKLFNALAVIGKWWNVEKKVIEGFKKERNFQCGQAVLVRDEIYQCWMPALFIDYHDEPSSYYPFITTKALKKMCIDYDSNKKLAYTQDNPE